MRSGRVLRRIEGSRMKVFQPCVHPERTAGLAGALAMSGLKLGVCGKTFSENVGPTNRYTEPDLSARGWHNVFLYEEDQIVSDPPDIVIVGREDAQRDIHRLIDKLSHKKFISIIGYSGNFHSNFDFAKLDGMICTDLATLHISRYHGVPALSFQPFFDFDAWPFSGFDQRKGLRLYSFINNFHERYPVGSKIFEQARERFHSDDQDGVQVVNYSGRSKPEVQNLMAASSALLHIKDQEGWGWSILEMLSIGRPAIVHSHLASKMAYQRWCVEGVSAFYFSTLRELGEIISRLSDADYRHSLQARTASFIRERINNAHSATELAEFLNFIAKQSFYKGGWSNRMPRVLASVPKWRPNVASGGAHSFEVTGRPKRQGEALCVPASFFSSRAATRVANCMELMTPSGPKYLVYGPYLELKPGRYKAVFLLNIENGLGDESGGAELYVDACRTIGDDIRIASTCQVKSASYEPGGSTSCHENCPSVTFEVDQACAKWEFRILWNEKMNLPPMRFFGVSLQALDQ